MIQSMTGFGKSDAEFNGKKIHVEVRSVNSKGLDLTTRLSSLYREKEMEVRRRISDRLVRGKVDFILWTEKSAETAGATLNADVVASYVRQIRQVSHDLGIAAPPDGAALWQTIMRLPDLCTTQQAETLSEEEWTVVSQTIDQALDAIVDYRTTEGKALEAKFVEKIDNIAAYQRQLIPFEEGRVQRIRERLEASLAELKGVDYDRGRLEQELIYYIEKLDINEEKQRLTQHLQYFRDTLADPVSQGKKLGFIAQEMGREINTTGSKSNQAEMQNIVVGMKDELEQIKEQVLNVL